MNPSHKAVYSPGNGEVEVYEIVVPDTWEGSTLGDLLDSVRHCYPVALSRAGKSSLPESNTILQAGDLLNVSSTLDGIGELTKRIAQKKLEA